MAGSLLLFGHFVSQQEQFVGNARAEGTAEVDIGSAREIYDGALFPDKAVRTYSSTENIFPTRTIKAGDKPYPLPVSYNPIKVLSFPSGGRTYDLPDYVALNRMVGLLILKDGKIVFEHYDFGFTPKARWMSMSIAKSFVSGATCCSPLFTATYRMVGRLAASQMASASFASFLPLFT